MRRVAMCLMLTVLFLVSPRSAGAQDVGSLIQQLDRTEWEIVSEEVSRRLPELIAGEEEQAHFKRLMRSSQEMAAMAEALQGGDYQGLGAVSANILARDLDKVAARRFGKDSRLYKSIQIIKDNPALATQLTRAALNADPYAATQAMGNSLKDYAEAQASRLRKQGEAFWKDMLRSVIPGGDTLASLGVDPVDLYLQGIRDWSDFTSRARLRFNNAMLDCLALRYRKIRDEGYSHADARLEIENFDTGTGIGRNFDCSSEMNRQTGGSGEKSIAQRFSDFFTSAGRSTAALGELGLTSGEIVDLIGQYEQTGAGNRGGEFSGWLQERLLKNIRTCADGLRAAIAEEQKRVAREQVSEAERLMAAIAAEIAKLDRDKPKTNASRGTGTGKPVAGKDDAESGDTNRAADTGDTGGKGKEKEKEKPELVKVTAECDRLTVLVKSADRRVGEASTSEASTFVSGLTEAEAAARKEGNCGSDVFASAADVRARLQQASALRARMEAAVKACNIEALDSLKAEASRIAPGAFDNEITLLQTARTGVDALNGGKAAFDAGRYDEARRRLTSSRDAFREMPGAACRSHADRAQKGLDNIAEIMEQKGVVDRAINTCEIDEMKRILGVYKNRKFRFFQESMARIRTALPECEKKQGIIAEGKFCDAARGKLDAARSDFAANKLKAARQALHALAKELNAENTKRCSDLKGRVEQGLSNLDVLKAEYERLAQSAKACDVDQLKGLVSHYASKDHPWYKEASVRARRVIEECSSDKPPSREEAIADCRRQVAQKGKVYATTRLKPDGGYSCHWCEQGQISNGRACVTDVAAAEANCRQKVASLGKVYGRTEIRPGGDPLCHWCEPGQVYSSGKCGTVAAHSELKCRQLAASKGKVYAATQVMPNGRLNCRWCEPGQVYSNGKCGTVAAHNETKCRQLAASKGKVYAATHVMPNGRLNCRWCEPGQYYSNGQCYSRQQAQPRGPAPQPGRSNCGWLPPPCHVDMSGTAAGMQRERACRARNAQLEQQYRACKARGG